MDTQQETLEKKLSDALLKCALHRVEKSHKTVFINRSPYVNAESVVRSFIDDFDIDEYRTVLYIDYSDKYLVFELSSADPDFSFELKNTDSWGNGIFKCEYLVNGSQTVEIWDDDFYYYDDKIAGKRLDKCLFREKREALNPKGFGLFGINLHTQFDRWKITNIIFAADCDTPSPHIMIDTPQCRAYGHLIGYSLYITTAAPKFILPEDMSCAFLGLPMLRNIFGLEYLDTSGVTNMSEMFSGVDIDDLDLSGFDTSNVTNMDGMFDGAGPLHLFDINDSLHHTLDLSGFSTKKVKSMFSISSNTSYDYIKLGDWDFNAIEDTFGILGTYPGDEIYDVRLMSNENLFALIKTNDCLFDWRFLCSPEQREWLQREDIRSQIQDPLAAIRFVEKDDWYE